MELDNTGDMLRKLFGGNTSSMNSDILTGSNEHPLSKINSIGMRTDILGTVLAFTREYANDWRTFDSYACMYKEDGTGRDPHHNLIGDCTDEHASKPLSQYTWVHPNHLQISSLFPIIEPGRGRLTAGQHYLNRMGFVILLEGSSTDSPQPMLRDTHGNLYYPTGRRYSEAMSMTDLVHEIKDWDHFILSDWSEPDVVKAGSKTSSPGYYDPAAESKEENRRRFYDALAEAHSLAKKIDATFTFSINTTK